MKINFWFEIVWGLANGVVLALELHGLGHKGNARITLTCLATVQKEL